jgi:hypothetical protein
VIVAAVTTAVALFLSPPPRNVAWLPLSVTFSRVRSASFETAPPLTAVFRVNVAPRTVAVPLLSRPPPFSPAVLSLTGHVRQGHVVVVRDPAARDVGAIVGNHDIREGQNAAVQDGAAVGSRAGISASDRHPDIVRDAKTSKHAVDPAGIDHGTIRARADDRQRIGDVEVSRRRMVFSPARERQDVRPGRERYRVGARQRVGLSGSRREAYSLPLPSPGTLRLRGRRLLRRSDCRRWKLAAGAEHGEASSHAATMPTQRNG